MGKIEAEVRVPVTQKSCEVLARLNLYFNRTGILTGKKDFQVP